MLYGFEGGLSDFCDFWGVVFSLSLETFWLAGLDFSYGVARCLDFIAESRPASSS